MREWSEESLEKPRVGVVRELGARVYLARACLEQE